METTHLFRYQPNLFRLRLHTKSKQTREKLVLADNKDFVAIRDVTKSEHAQQQETDTDILLEECPASLHELLGSKPSSMPGATVLAANTEDHDHTSNVGI